MARRLKVYVHKESCNCFLPPEVIEALGEPRHVRQGALYVWATTAADAAQRLDELGMRINSPRDLRVAEHGTATTLHAAHDWPDGTVLAMRMSGGGTVTEITENPNRSVIESPRALRTVGELSREVVFRPVADIDPVVTPAMVDAAMAVFELDPESTVGPTELRTALAAALKAQRVEL